MRTLFLYLTTILLFSSCSGLFKTKSVNIIADDSTTVYVNEYNLGKSSSKIKLKDYGYRDIKYEYKKEGYYNKTGILYPSKHNPGIWITLFNPLNFISPVFTLATLFEYNGYHKRFEKNWELEMEKFPIAADSLLEMNFSRIDVDESFEFTTNYYSSVRKWKNNKSQTNRLSNTVQKTIHLNHTEFESYSKLNYFMEEMKLKSEESIQLINYKDYNIQCKLVKLDQNVVKLYKNTPFTYYNMSFHYIVKDKYGRVIYDGVVTGISDQYFETTDISTIFYDGFKYSTLELMKTPEIQSILNKKTTTVEKPKSSVFEIPPSSPPTIDSIPSMAHYLYRHDKKIIGLPISKDGLIAFSKSAVLFHDNDSLFVYNAKGDSAYAVPHLEMASNEFVVLKTDLKFDNYFSLNSGKLEIGNETLLIGYDREFNTVIMSKGIISAERKQSRTKVYQIDAEANYMIYPIVLSKEGKINGFISRKLDSYKINSISFFPALHE